MRLHRLSVPRSVDTANRRANALHSAITLAAVDFLDPGELHWSIEAARGLAAAFRTTAAERDARGGTPKAERDLIRASGLLRLVVPSSLGGAGGDWAVALTVVRELAVADASLAHVLGYHYLGVATPHIFGTARQRDLAYTEVARDNLFWGNALNPLDLRTTITRQGGGLVLRGAKSFASGSGDSDRLVVSATEDDSPALHVLVVPTRADGVTVHDDWDNMGQRQTDSGSVTFDNVTLSSEALLGPPGPGASPFGTLRTCIVQAILAHVYVGLARGAIVEAAPYTRASARAWPARAWPGSSAAAAAEDPLVLRSYGEMETLTAGAEALCARAANLVQAGWQRGEMLTVEERGQIAVAVATARASAARTALQVTSQMFEAMGSRATSARLRYDRFWRNARTLTLHDPIEHKLREIGDWVVNGRPPTPGSYS
ncbi:MAG: acyl-CoA dehydrogenase family protein [Chloroflexi bacterium]|nr:acyl-CoA dehydrogenase family protein [Chloroflexota bacterium]